MHGGRGRTGLFWLRVGLCLAALVGTGLSFEPPVRISRPVARHAATRLPEIDEALQRASPDAVLLAGNSHAEIAGLVGDTCGVELMRAGVGGVRAHEYAAILPRLRRSRRMREAVLLIGTNDILHRNAPLSPHARARFSADVASIVAQLAERADRITVAAVPPIGPQADRNRDPAAIPVYSKILRGLCREPNCRFVDPFETLRGAQRDVAVPGSLPDGIHLADYPAMLAALDLCPARSAGTVGR